jgi:DNA-binding NarL/FixJ family response regulator
VSPFAVDFFAHPIGPVSGAPDSAGEAPSCRESPRTFEAVDILGQRPQVIVTASLPADYGGQPPDGPAVLLMSAATEQRLRAVMTAGVRAYLDRDVDEATLLRAIVSVAQGDAYLSKAVSALLAAPEPAGRAASAGPPPLEPKLLTSRECAVLRLIAQGLTHQQIANRLSLAKSTVDTYAHRVRQKTGAGNKADLTRIGLSLGGDASA